MVGERVKWKALNGIVEGTVVEKAPSKKGGDWYVRLDNGKDCIVNETSFIK